MIEKALHERQKVLVVYHMFPHYRRGIMTELSRSNRYNYIFFGSDASFDGVAPMKMPGNSEFFRRGFYRLGRLYWQRGLVAHAFLERYDAVVFLENPNFLATWLAAVVLRMRGTRILLWGHGWRRREAGLKLLFRHLYYRLADKLLVYSRHSRSIGIELGFCASRIDVVFNSLNAEEADVVYRDIRSGRAIHRACPQDFFQNKADPVVICTARLTAHCRFEILLEAAAYLKNSGDSINVLLVGDGPEKPKLQSYADELQVSVHFFGSCYDEAVLGQLLYHADVTVSPGKIGLTALHSLIYGTPAISHNCLDNQMPEVETIVEGETGALFEESSPTSLALAIKRCLLMNSDRESVRRRCRDLIEREWNSTHQRAVIEHNLDEVLGRAAEPQHV